MAKTKAVMIELVKVGAYSKKTEGKPVRRKLYQDQFGYYIVQGKIAMGVRTIIVKQTENGWVSGSDSPTEYRRWENHTEENVVKA